MRSLATALVQPDDALATYRYLRIGLVSAVAFLATSVIGTWISSGLFQGSISAFYYTTTHAAFVGALCAIGLGLIAYKGSTGSEDVLLNSAGFLAFVVAFVPTRKPGCTTEWNRCGGYDPTPAEFAAGMQNNLVALLVASAVGFGIYCAIKVIRPSPAGQGQNPEPPGRHRRFVRAARAAQVGFVGVGIVVLWLSPNTFYGWAHNVAAVTMFACIVLVVAKYASYSLARGHAQGHPTRFSAWYVAITRGMTGILLLTVFFHFALPGYWVLIAEAFLITGFALFWVVQTVDLWAQEDKYRRSHSRN